MAEDREQILADFQSCTGVDDVGECIMHLEAAHWNLLDAIHTVMPEETQTLPSERVMDVPMEIAEEINIPPGDSKEVNHAKMNNSEILPSSNVMWLPDGPSHPPPPRILNFAVRYLENLVPLEVPDSETVGSVKTALHAELGVPPCRQELCGWQGNHITDDTVLSSLQLAPQTNLFLSTADPLNLHSTPNSEQFSLTDRLNMSYHLHVIDATNNKEYDLHFPGSKTVLEIKLGLDDITDIPVRFQHWVGWPEAAKDENMKLSNLGITTNVLELILSREENVPKTRKQLVVDLTSSESSENEFEDAAECFGVDDEMFQAGSSSKRVQPLMPECIKDELSAVSHFEEEFTNRYLACHPSFFQGTFADALQSSCQKSAKDRRPLAIYLHHDSSVLTNVFCTQLLCSETVVTYLTINFITWAWDLSYESNKTRKIVMPSQTLHSYTPEKDGIPLISNVHACTVSQNLGLAAATTIKNIPLDHLPALMVITKVRSTSEVLTVIPGNVGLDELMTRLIHAVEVFNSEITTEIWEEEEREAREQVKREQDAAYEASLMADRAKEEVRRQEEEQRQEQEVRELQKKEKLEQIRQQEEALKEAFRKSLAEQLPSEPEEDTALPVSHIRVRLPNGMTIGRRFLATDPLNLLLTYIASQGYPSLEYKVLASWPRRDLTALNGSSSLEELSLFPKETLTLEER